MTATDDELAVRLQVHARRAGLFPEPGRVLLAVSGGPDSLALLDLMVRIAPELDLELAVAHVDHGIAAESPDVAESVMGLAVRYQLPGYLTTLGLGADASETRARRERYRALRVLQTRVDARYLATAHHADDQIETILFRLLRGTGMAGLAGIAARGADGLVRPLLPFRKRELAEWLATRPDGPRATAHADPANVDLRHHRSWIRGSLLPLVRDRFADTVDGHLLDVGRHAAADRSAWEAALRTLPELGFRAERGLADVAWAPLLRYDNTLSEALLRALAREAGCVLGPRRAERLLAFVRSAPSGRMFELGQQWIAEIAFERLRILVLKETLTGVDGIVRWGEGEEGRIRWGEWEICWSPDRAGEAERHASVTWVTEGGGEVRSPQPGDRIRPLRGRGRRRVSRVLMEGRVPRSERHAYPVLTRGEDVVWLPGICRSDAALPATGESAIRLEVNADRHT